MPKKASAAPAGGDEKKAAPKVEKATVAAVEEKKPAQVKGQPKQQDNKQQPKQDNKPQDNKPQDNKPQDNKSQDNKQQAKVQEQDNRTNQTSSPAFSQERRTFAISDDPVEASIQKRLNAIEDEIIVHRAEIVCSFT
jgi:hypothetical protein